MPQSGDQDIIDQVCQLIGQRAANIYLTRQLRCSGAVLVALNQALGGDLSQETAIRLTAGMGDGMGGSGCLCGALNGGVLALGLFLGKGRLSPGGDKMVLKATRQLQDQFKMAFGASCCRILTKNTPEGCRSQNQACAQRTAKTTELTAELILGHRPLLSRQIDWSFLSQKDGIIGARIKIYANQLLK